MSLLVVMSTTAMAVGRGHERRERTTSHPNTRVLLMLTWMLMMISETAALFAILTAMHCRSYAPVQA